MGITVALGTDGAGSASTLDMFEEIKAAAWMQKNKYYDPKVVNAYQVLHMATVEGVKALGMKVVMQNRKLTLIDEKEVLNHTENCARRITGR